MLFVATVDIYYAPDFSEEEVLGVYSSFDRAVTQILEFMLATGYELTEIKHMGNNLLGDTKPGLCRDENVVHAVFGHIHEFKLDE